MSWGIVRVVSTLYLAVIEGNFIETNLS